MARAIDHEGRVIAAFDFDGTLTMGDSLLPFLRLALGWPRLLLKLTLCSPWLAAYALGLMDNHRAKARLLWLCLHGSSVQALERVAQRFVEGVLPKAWRAEAIAELRRHQDAGHRCVIVSASPDIYLRAASRQLGVAHLICTEMQVRQGLLTGVLQTPNCHGREKAIRLGAWITANAGPPGGPPVTLYAYGDSRGDADMLALAHYAFLRGKPLARPLELVRK